MKMSKGERLVAEMLGDVPVMGMPVLTEAHPFLRKVTVFMKTRDKWLGTAADLLRDVGDDYTPTNTAAKLLRRYDYEYLCKKHRIDVTFRRTSRKRLIELRRL